MARKLTEAQKAQRAEYSRMRSIMSKRIQRAQARGELLNQTVPPSLKEIGKGKGWGRRLAKEQNAVNKFLNSPYSTAAGRAQVKQKRFEGYERAGYKNITESNEKKFAKFMEHMIKKYTEETPNGKRMLHDSDSFAEFYDEMEEKDRIHENTRLSDLVKMFNRWVG